MSMKMILLENFYLFQRAFIKILGLMAVAESSETIYK